MGRPKFFRQRILTQAASLEAKGLFNYLVSEIRVRREVSLECSRSLSFGLIELN